MTNKTPNVSVVTKEKVTTINDVPKALADENAKMNEIMKALKQKNPLKILKEGLKSVKVLSKRRSSMVHYIISKKCYNFCFVTRFCQLYVKEYDTL